MKEKKNIERLFQEKFKDFEVIPPHDAWENIEARLENKKKKRRVIPFWLKPAGIAAGIAIFIGVFSLFNNDDKVINNKPIQNNSTNSVVNQTEDNQNNSPQNNSNFEKEVNSSYELNKVIQENDVVTERNVIKSSSNKINNKSETNTIQNFTESQDRLVFENKTNKKQQKSNNSSSNSSKNIIRSQSDETQETIFNSDENNSLTLNDNINSQKEKEGLKGNKNNKIDYNKSVLDELIANGNNEELVNNSFEKTNSNSISNKIDGQSNKVNEDVIFNQVSIDTLKINQVLANNIEESKDSIHVVENSKEKEENELEKLLKEKEEGKNADEKEEEKRNRWVVSTNAAPVYFNSFSEGSPLDSQFQSNSKSYETSISYGVGVEYSLAKKIALRVGINKVDFSYNVQDVVFYQNVNAKQLENVNTNQAGRMISVVSQFKEEGNSINVSGVLDTKFEGALNQQLGYIEVPLEMSYKVIDKKLGVDIIGGMSSLFLQENSVSLKSNGTQMGIGEANNLNDVHFSGNLGLGLRYTFWKSFNANFQPMLKYQFNTFSENSGNFKPYFVGLYTGLSYSF